ncbi:MAG: hypothetical protein AAF726_13230 [Planctomycetota bacterium]
MRQSDPDSDEDIEAVLQDAAGERREDLQHARGANAAPDLRESFLEQMKATPARSVPSARPRRPLVLVGVAAAAAAGVLLVAQNRSRSTADEVDPRGPLMHGDTGATDRRVELVDIRGPRVTVKLGAGFLDAGYYAARASTSSGEVLAESLGESADRWSFDLPKDREQPDVVVIDVELFLQGSTVAEESWSSTVSLMD